MGRRTYVPNNPVVLGSNKRAPNTILQNDKPVLSGVVGDNRELIAEVRRLWVLPSDVVADVTWGRGAFWPRDISEGDQPQYRFDIASLENPVDCRELPLDDCSVDVIVFDPPYRPNHGGDQGSFYSHYGLARSGLDTMDDVLRLYAEGIREAYRVTKEGGRILIKCQDMTYSDRLHLVHLDVVRAMNTVGFEFCDMFVLVNTRRRQASSPQHVNGEQSPKKPKLPRQKRARRSHSYLLVGMKGSAARRAI